MSRRLGSNLDPTRISSFKFGSTEFDEDLHKEILKNTRHMVDTNKVQLSVTQSLMQWSLFKKELLTKSSYKKEMLRDGSKFHRVGISTRESFTTNFSKFGQAPPKTAQTIFNDAQKEEFFKESEQSLTSDDSVLDLHSEKPPSPPKAPNKQSAKAKKIIDLTKEPDLLDL